MLIEGVCFLEASCSFMLKSCGVGWWPIRFKREPRVQNPFPFSIWGWDFGLGLGLGLVNIAANISYS